ncbi:DUF6236 family protein [Streptomyces sp. NPDC127168]|uniref:DUF6236 family protein n=1 Tax=unclassified Streptomyces TaxID=2593676 RepID=UPI0036417E3E
MQFAGGTSWAKTRRLPEPSAHDEDLRTMAYRLIDMAGVLLGEAAVPADTREGLAARARVGALSVRYVLPDRLGTAPVDRIVQLRTRYEAEFRAFSDAVERTAHTLQDCGRRRQSAGTGDAPARGGAP